jgi:hypothetical protein
MKKKVSFSVSLPAFPPQFTHRYVPRCSPTASTAPRTQILTNFENFVENFGAPPNKQTTGAISREFFELEFFWGEYFFPCSPSTKPKRRRCSHAF